MALQPGAPPTLSRRSSSSSIEVAFATPPTSPVLPPSVTRIPKPVHHTPSSHHLQQPSSSHPTDTPPPPPPPPPQTAAAPPVTTTTTPQAKPPVANGTPRSRSKSTPSASRIPFVRPPMPESVSAGTVSGSGPGGLIRKNAISPPTRTIGLPGVRSSSMAAATTTPPPRTTSSNGSRSRLLGEGSFIPRVVSTSPSSSAASSSSHASSGIPPVPRRQRSAPGLVRQAVHTHTAGRSPLPTPRAPVPPEQPNSAPPRTQTTTTTTPAINIFQSTPPHPSTATIRTIQPPQQQPPSPTLAAARRRSVSPQVLAPEQTRERSSSLASATSSRTSSLLSFDDGRASDSSSRVNGFAIHRSETRSSASRSASHTPSRTPSPTKSISPPTASLVHAAAATAAQRRLTLSTSPEVLSPSGSSVNVRSKLPRRTRGPSPVVVRSPTGSAGTMTSPSLETVIASPTTASSDRRSGPTSRIPSPMHRTPSKSPTDKTAATLSPPLPILPDAVQGTGPGASSSSGATPDNHWTSTAPRRASGNGRLTSPRPDRKSPGLTISPPPPPPSSRLSLVPHVPPPLPAKSPLRQLSSGTLSTPATRRSVVISLASPESAGSNSSTPAQSRSGQATPRTPNVNLNGSTPPLDTINKVDPSPMVYTPALMTPWSAPVETNMKRNSQYIESGPPSAPPESANSWVVGAIPAESPQDMSPMTPLDGTFQTLKRTTEPEPWAPGPSENDQKALPAVPPMAELRTPKTPTTPVRPGVGSNFQSRSPSMPTLSSTATSRARGATESHPSPGMARARPGMNSVASLSSLPTPGRRPQSMMVGGSSPISPSASTSLSRRAHLMREIAATERAHATDLALICEAYLPLDEPDYRPESHHSSSNGGDSMLTDSTRAGLRSSSYGSPADDPRRTSAHQGETWRTSGHERRLSGMEWNSGGTPPPLPKSSFSTAGSLHTNGSFDSLGPSSASGSLVTAAVLPSPRFPLTSSSSSSPGPGASRMLPPVGLPLSKADRKAVFLNIRELALAADELATEFEDALGTDEETLVASGGQSGTDRLGHVFSRMLPRLGPLFMYYCPRQSAASSRLLELQANPMHAAHLNECWQRVRSHTHAWNLDSMLIKPVQRITKYPLLFEDLLSCTTPAHPDYFAIRQAAEGARALAGDIDEAKRRKDVITSVIGKSPSTVSLIKEPKNARAGGRGLLLSRFKKDRSPMASGGPSPGDSTSAPQVISPYAQTQLSELVQRLEESESLVTRLGKEILVWREKCQIVIKNEADLNIHFLNWYTLEGKIKMDPQTAKVAAYQALISELAATVWKEMEGEVCGGTNQNSRSVMLMLGTLMDAVKNPKMIIDKLNKKSADYARYVAYASAKKSVDRPLLLEASEYVAIHTQLLEELPAFLEGYNRILEIAVAAFVGAQVRYYGAMRDRIVKYTDKFLTVPTDEQVTDRGDICEVKLDVSTFRGIHKAWIDRFREPHMMMKNLEITGGDGTRIPAPRTTSFGTRRTANTASARPNSGSSRPSSYGQRSSVTSELVTPPTLRHTPSLHSTRSESRSSSGAGRRRSSSLATPSETRPDAVRATTGGDMRPPETSALAGLIRRNSYKSKNGNSTTSSLTSGMASFANRSVTNLGLRQSVKRTKSQTRASTLSSQASTEEHERHSFGLPRITPTSDPLFDALGLSGTPSKAGTPVHGYADIPASLLVSPTELNFGGLGLGTMTPLQHTSAIYVGDDADPGETWRDSPILYACAAVADFNPADLGNHRFQGLVFLPLAAGDLVDVFHEIGRVADLHDFPYSQVGVENDGAVVCRAENGLIGVAMCSFLEPLRT